MRKAIFGIIYLFLTILSVRADTERCLRAKIIADCYQDLGVREITPNCSPEIEAWCRLHGLNCGPKVYWCAIYVGAKYLICGVHAQLNAWSPSWFIPERRVAFEKVKQADCFGLYSISQQRIVHIGLVEKIEHRDVYTYEGNSNQTGSSNGDRVCRNIRDKDSIKYYANWISPLEIHKVITMAGNPYYRKAA